MTWQRQEQGYVGGEEQLDSFALSGLSEEEYKAASHAVTQLRDRQRAAQTETIEAAKIPPVTLLLRGAYYSYGSRHNPAYVRFRNSVTELVGLQLLPSQVGRLASRLAMGKLPKGGFNFEPRKGITYTGADYSFMTMNGLGKALGEETAGYIIRLFRAMVNVEPEQLPYIDKLGSMASE